MKKQFLKAKYKSKEYYFLVENGGIKSLSEKNSVFQIEIFPSLQCNLNCLYCDRGREKSILKDFNDISVLYDNLKDDVIFHPLNFKISGGEPTLYPKINELISFLSNLNPYAKIVFLTNGIALERLTKESLKKIDLSVSVYPYTRNILQKNGEVAKLLGLRKRGLEANVLFHEDLQQYGRTKNGFDPLSLCISAVLLGGTKRVYPCCRAHRFEQMYRKNYHFYIHTQNLYAKLKGLIENTDLCSHCPRMYKDARKISLDYAKPEPAILL